MRVFEAMACGSLMLTDDRSDVNRRFKEGEEIVIYRDLHDLRNKVAYYLNHDKARQAIGQAGMRRVLTTHTFGARLRSTEAVITQFHQECRELTILAALVGSDPAKAARFARYLVLEGVIEFDLENLRLLEAKAHLAMGDVERAKSSIAEVLAVNPRHIEAATCARRLVEAEKGVREAA